MKVERALREQAPSELDRTLAEVLDEVDREEMVRSQA